MNKKVAILIIIITILNIIAVVHYCNSEKNVETSKVLTVGKETTIVTIVIHDTIHDSIPYETIKFKEKVRIVKIFETSNPNKDSLKNSDSSNCFEFTKTFEGIGTANVQTCSKTFTKKPEDLNIQMWFYPLPDSIKTVLKTDTLNITNTITIPPNYYKNVAYGTGLLILGVVIGKNWK